MSQGCSSGLYYFDSSLLSTLALRTVPFLAVCLLLGVFLFVIGLVITILSPNHSRLYRISACMTAEAIIKIGLIPQVEVRIARDALKRKDEETSLNRGSEGEPGTVARATSSVTLEGHELQDNNWKYSDSVCFDINGELFPVRYTYSVIAFPLVALMLTAYMSLFVTNTWQKSTICSQLDPITSQPKICYYLTECVNRVNCSAWQLANRKEELICSTFSIDFFKPLIQIASLLAVQLTIMNFGVTVFNRGWACCRGSKTWVRYCLISILEWLFVFILLGVGLYHLLHELAVKGKLTDTFINYLIPIGNMMFVAITEATFLLSFTLMICFGPQFSIAEDQKRTKKDRTGSATENQPGTIENQPVEQT